MKNGAVLAEPSCFQQGAQQKGLRDRGGVGRTRLGGVKNNTAQGRYSQGYSTIDICIQILSSESVIYMYMYMYISFF